MINHETYILNTQAGVADSKNVVSDNALLSRHVIRRMRIANFALHCSTSAAIYPISMKVGTT